MDNTLNLKETNLITLVNNVDKTKNKSLQNFIFKILIKDLDKGFNKLKKDELIKLQLFEKMGFSQKNKISEININDLFNDFKNESIYTSDEGEYILSVIQKL